jgi:uncharacterized membrane protein (DUF485 family)
MLHEPAAKCEDDFAVEYKQRLGVWMFLIYAIVYAAFVAINLIEPKLMESAVALGLNLAVFYGFALIIFALILAVIYNALCIREEKRHEDLSKGVK